MKRRASCTAILPSAQANEHEAEVEGEVHLAALFQLRAREESRGEEEENDGEKEERSGSTGERERDGLARVGKPGRASNI